MIIIRYKESKEVLKEVKDVKGINKFFYENYQDDKNYYNDFIGDTMEQTINNINGEFNYLYEELGYPHFEVVLKTIEEKTVLEEEQVKSLKELKQQYEDLTTIKNFEDLKDLASNFIRMVTWKKVKDLPYIKMNFTSVQSSIIKHILRSGFDEALKEVKKDNLHKAYNLVYLYGFYGLDFKEEKAKIKENAKSIL